MLCLEDLVKGLPIGLNLSVQSQKLCLSITDDASAGSLFVDFTSARLTYRRQQALGAEAVVKAVGGCVPASAAHHVIDATAGLGEDAFVLAAAGWHVSLIEQSPVIHALLADGLTRARRSALDQANSGLGEILARMTLSAPGDSADLMQGLTPAKVIYLDPMFPERSKSARVKKNRYLLQYLHADEALGESLLPIALRLSKKVIVKRPRLAPPLSNIVPSSSRTGKTSRFDIYVGL